MGAQAARRKVYCVLSAKSLPYAHLAFESLLERCLEGIDLTLITDGATDKAELVAAMASIPASARHLWRVADKAEADEKAERILGSHSHVAQFRSGHPCWRKITDPMLFAADGEEMIILDPDLYFPNHFRFEPTPTTGLLLMHQPPSCLLPPEVVEAAFDAGISMAHHTDIGVAQIRAPIDLDWLDGLVATLGGESLPRSMHVESIVWAAMALKEGGGYLDPMRWHCWQNAQWKRVARKVGVSGRTILRVERFGDMKCFHGGGVAKWWIPDAVSAGELPPPRTIASDSQSDAFVPLTRQRYHDLQRVKAWARRLGYYRWMRSG